MLRTLTAVFMTSASLMGATAAQAGTHWSIGVNVPAVGMVVSNAPRYPVYQAAPVYYTPAPRYMHREIYYAPPPRVVYEAPRHGHWHHHHGHDRRHDRRESRREHDRHERWDSDRDHGPHRGR